MQVRPYPNLIQAKAVVQKNVSATPTFWISQIAGVLWLLFCIWLSISWVERLSQDFGSFLAYFIVAGIAYIPGYISAFTLTSLLLGNEKIMPVINPSVPVTILIAARNEELGIGKTLEHIGQQDYSGPLEIILIDNGSTDSTVSVAQQAGKEFGLSLKILHENNPGKHHALNFGLSYVTTNYIITLDADTFLHPSAIRNLAAKILASARDVHAVAGSLLVQNKLGSFMARMQEWEYYLNIASIKRMQSIYHSTLVAQGAFSIFRVDAVRKAGGWPDSIGEDIVLTWKLFANKARVGFEPSAIAFTEVPESFIQFARQRKRWARGMIEALKQIPPWTIQSPVRRFFTGIDLVIPFIDLCLTLFWIPGLLLCLFGYYGIVGPNAMIVLPVNFFIYYMLYLYQKRVLEQLGIHVKKNIIGLAGFLFLYQLFLAPVALVGYAEELFKQKRIWK